jgi:hypothetical protein
MTNRGFTRAELLHHTILTNRASMGKEPDLCPECGASTRDAMRGGKLTRVCGTRACSWIGEHQAEREAQARAANEAMGISSRDWTAEEILQRAG